MKDGQDAESSYESLSSSSATSDSTSSSEEESSDAEAGSDSDDNQNSDESNSNSVNSSNNRSYDPDSSDLDSQGSNHKPAHTLMHISDHGGSHPMVISDGTNTKWMKA